MLGCINSGSCIAITDVLKCIRCIWKNSISVMEHFLNMIATSV